MEVHLAPGQPPRLTGAEDLRRFSVIVSASRDALSELAEAARGVLAFEGSDHAWVSAEWLVEASGQSDRTDWRAEFHAMVDYATRKGWTRRDPVALRGHVVWQGG